MQQIASRNRAWLPAAVLAHLVVVFVHGTAHARAQIALSGEANLFVYVVIVAGPLIGLALLWRTLFATSALLLAVTEAIGAGIAFRLVRERKSS